jgi:hypothetical protein
MLRDLICLVTCTAAATAWVACADTNFNGTTPHRDAPTSTSTDGGTTGGQPGGGTAGGNPAGNTAPGGATAGPNGPGSGINGDDGNGFGPNSGGNGGSGSDGALGSVSTETGTGLGTGTAADLGIDNGQLACSPGQQGYVGLLFQLPENTAALPDLDSMTPLGQVTALTLDVPPRDWTQGFPGIPNLTTWFAIEFFAALNIPTTGTYYFRTSSDDGSKVYLDQQLVVNNDGVHAPKTADSTPLSLTQGEHELKIQWYQGPPVQIALQVYWKPPGASDFAIIPATALSHGINCNLQTVGHFP